jgi:biofilm PGA synthesis lipoprotein PgaB
MAVLLFAGGAGLPGVAAERTEKNRLLVLCYHDIPKEVWLDNFAVDRDSFVQQIEYLRTHGYHFVGLDDVLKAHGGEKELPPKAVLLSFDDAYQSYYDFVYPLLKAYGYPSMLAVISGWVERQPKDLKQKLMTWSQLREVAQSGLVSIASHTDGQHYVVQDTPQGSSWYAIACRRYFPDRKAYESEDERRQRFNRDFTLSKIDLERQLGVPVRAIVWPFGEFNRTSIEEAHKAGFEAMFSLDDTFASAGNIEDIPRYIVARNPSITEFIYALNHGLRKKGQQRALQADLDLLHDPDPKVEQRNIDAFIQRAVDMQVNAVYLQAFCDEKGDGNIASAYFSNRVLPVKADIFNYVANQLAIRGIEVYAWMPTLSLALPDYDKHTDLYVNEFIDGEKRITRAWYRRLSPFNDEAVEKLAALYEDMAVNGRIAGVIFQDDGYLNDYEDFSAPALAEYRRIAGDDAPPFKKLDSVKKKQWTRLKTGRIIAVTERLKRAVRLYRPHAKFIRTIYARPLTDPKSEEWFAQNYGDSLAAYDFVAVMAYPYMEEEKKAGPWLKKLVAAAKQQPGGLEKTVFKVQAYDWKRSQWLEADEICRWLRTLAAAGAQNLAYYPDNCLENIPDGKTMRRIMSTEDFPFKRSLEEKMRH